MSKKVFLILAVLAAALVSWPNLNFQALIAQGDLGRDFYTFEQVLHGKIIYKDIWWVYGPLMPYYYGLFYLLFGFKITSIFLGKFLISVLCGAIFYLASCELMPVAWAFLASCFFMRMQQDFFFTYNHIGGIALILVVFWLLLKYIHENNLKLALWALAACFLIGLIKIDFGLSALITTLVSITVINFFAPDKNKKLLASDTKIFYLWGLLIIPLLWSAIYFLLLKDLSINEIRQCMPYFGNDQPYHSTPDRSIPYFFIQHWLTFLNHWLSLLKYVSAAIDHPSDLLSPTPILMFSLVILNFLTNPIMHGSTIAAFILSFTKKFDGRRREFWLAQFVLWLFFIINFAEFVTSAIWYRTYWSQPFQTFFNFYMIAIAMSFASKWVRYTIGGIWIAFFSLLILIGFFSTQSSCTPDKFLNMPRGQVYVGNEAAWVDTVNTVTAYLNKTLKKDELFFALPYDCIYYYLTGRPSPSRQLIFFDHIKILSRQEFSIIQELERNNVNYVLLSNRMSCSQQGLGVFGVTYCPLIYQYIKQNFTPLYHYGGRWDALPGWADNHGVIILKRNGS